MFSCNFLVSYLHNFWQKNVSRFILEFDLILKEKNPMFYTSLKSKTKQKKTIELVSENTNPLWFSSSASIWSSFRYFWLVWIGCSTYGWGYSLFIWSHTPWCTSFIPIRTRLGLTWRWPTSFCRSPVEKKLPIESKSIPLQAWHNWHQQSAHEATKVYSSSTPKFIQFVSGLIKFYSQ